MLRQKWYESDAFFQNISSASGNWTSVQENVPAAAVLGKYPFSSMGAFAKRSAPPKGAE
jgi:hypothetical protein